jgi:hypothetical protein
VDFIVNASYPLVLDWLSKASIGLSTMVDEHFGINVVEFMVSGAFFSLGLGTVLIVFLSQAAGVIPVAHASGGPLKDIIVPFNGENTGVYSRSSAQRTPITIHCTHCTRVLNRIPCAYSTRIRRGDASGSHAVSRRRACNTLACTCMGCPTVFGGGIRERVEPEWVEKIRRSWIACSIEPF